MTDQIWELIDPETKTYKNNITKKEVQCSCRGGPVLPGRVVKACPVHHRSHKIGT